jgi:Protein of unknown function (DUF3060)
MRTHIAIAVTAAALSLGLAGCGSSGDSEAPIATAGTSGAQVEIGNTINYGSFGTTADIDCAQGKALNVGGSNNNLTVKGNCSSVNIGGADNKVTLDNVETEISVVGLDNTVVYKGGDPKVEDLGSGNKVSKG